MGAPYIYDISPLRVNKGQKITRQVERFWIPKSCNYANVVCTTYTGFLNCRASPITWLLPR